MSFKRVYKCSNCGKIYEEKPQRRCSCQKEFMKGAIISSFELLEDKNSAPEVWVRCLLCDMSKKLHYTNLRRQKSCGCVPRHIAIESVNKQSVKYVCRKCDNISHVKVPIITYCCEGEE